MLSNHLYGDFRFVSIDNDSESDKDKLIDLEPEPTQNILEVALPDKLDPHKIGFQVGVLGNHNHRSKLCFVVTEQRKHLLLKCLIASAFRVTNGCHRCNKYQVCHGKIG